MLRIGWGMRAGRLLSMMILLQLRVRLTAEQLAEEFEVSVRTVYRDIEELSAAGVPIYGDRGPGGGFQLVDGYRTRLTGLAADEAEAVFMIGMPGTAEALGLGAAAEGAARKVLAALPEHLSNGAGRLGARFHLDPVDWYHDAEPTPHLPVLARAVLDEKAVAITYESWTGVRDSRVEPLGLVLKASTWYLVAQGGGTPRIYRVGKVRSATVEDTAVVRPVDFDLPAFWAAELQRFESTLRPGVATLLVSSSGRLTVARLGAYAAVAIRDAEPADDGWWRVRFPIENVDHAAALLLGLGSQIRIVNPPELRARVHALASALAEHHRPAEQEIP